MMLRLKYLTATFLLVLICSTVNTLSAAGLTRGKHSSKTYIQQAQTDSAKAKKDTAVSASPRDGKYLILSYGSNPANPLRLGYFTLASNEYKYYDLENKVLGDGTYVYDVAEKEIKWQSGPFKAIGWSGNFTVERNGKTHSIRLKNNTVGTNTVE
jgi:hypothetical protein